MLLDELTSRFHRITHQHPEHFVGRDRILHGDFQQRPFGRIHGRVPQFFRVHFTQSLEAGDLHPSFTQFTQLRQQFAQASQLDRVIFLDDLEWIERLTILGSRWIQVWQQNSITFQFHECGVNRPDFMQVDNLQQFLAHRGGCSGSMRFRCDLWRRDRSRHRQFAAKSLFFLRNEFPDLFLVEEPVLGLPQEDSVFRQAVRCSCFGVQEF